MEHLLHQILTIVQNTEKRVGNLERDIDIMKTDMGIMKADINTMKADIDILKVKVANLEEKVDHLKGRQDEMYLILRGWEEDRPIIRSALDKLDIEVARLKKHRHSLHIYLGEPEPQHQQSLP